ncbi:hypothetical protein BX666DRAFT_1416413 [Dichotomocladium elegans]|nr:hypothetical protein BX666DRAFT_1416413 [Dichotomocladium elegans]
MPLMILLYLLVYHACSNSPPRLSGSLNWATTESNPRSDNRFCHCVVTLLAFRVGRLRVAGAASAVATVILARVIQRWLCCRPNDLLTLAQEARNANMSGKRKNRERNLIERTNPPQSQPVLFLTCFGNTWVERLRARFCAHPHQNSPRSLSLPASSTLLHTYPDPSFPHSTNLPHPPHPFSLPSLIFMAPPRSSDSTSGMGLGLGLPASGNSTFHQRKISLTTDCPPTGARKATNSSSSSFANYMIRTARFTSTMVQMPKTLSKLRIVRFLGWVRNTGGRVVGRAW